MHHEAEHEPLRGIPHKLPPCFANCCQYRLFLTQPCSNMTGYWNKIITNVLRIKLLVTKITFCHLRTIRGKGNSNGPNWHISMVLTTGFDIFVYTQNSLDWMQHFFSYDRQLTQATLECLTWFYIEHKPTAGKRPADINNTRHTATLSPSTILSTTSDISENKHSL